MRFVRLAEACLTRADWRCICTVLANALSALSIFNPAQQVYVAEEHQHHCIWL